MTRTGLAGTNSSGGLIVSSYAELPLLGAAPAAPAAGKTRLYVDSNGLLQLIPAAGSARRMCTDWGAGSTPPAGAQRGDVYLYTPAGGTVANLLTYDGARWRFPGDRGTVASAAERDSVSIAYDGLRLFVTAGAAAGEWLYLASAPAWVPLGQWTEYANATYLYNLTATIATIPAIAGGADASFTVTVPAGRTLDVELHVPQWTVNVNTNAWIRLIVGTAGAVLDGAYASTNAATGFAIPLLLSGSVKGTGVPVTINPQAWLSGGTSSIQRDAGAVSTGAPLKLRWRIT